MKNKAVVVLINEVSFAAEILRGEFVDKGIVFLLSEKSGVRIWTPKNEIKSIVLPDMKELCGEELDKLFAELDRVCVEFGLEEE